MTTAHDAAQPRPTTPAAAWSVLAEGNARYTEDRGPTADTGRTRRAELSAGQHPFALVFGCSDSRVPPEVVFDQGLGDLFVVRTAGHTADSAVLGSLEFGVGVLGIPLVLVLGHEACGAVAAAATTLDGGSAPGGHLREVVEMVTPSVVAAREQGATSPQDLEAEHVRRTAALLGERSTVLAAAVAEGRCAVVGATYALGTGQVHLLDLGDVSGASAPPAR